MTKSARNIQFAFILILSVWLVNFEPLGALGQEKNRGEQEKKTIVCSTTQIADFARNIVGDRWNVVSILGPGQDPHTHEVTAANAKLVADADLCFQNGWNLEGHAWMEKICEQAGKKCVTCVDGVTPRRINEDGEIINDPHAWFSIPRAKIYVRNIYRTVAAADPENKDEYLKNASKYLVELDKLDDWIKKEISQIPPPRVLATHHDAFGYFAADYKFEIVSLAKWSTEEIGGGSSLERRNELISTVRKKGVKALFAETSIDPEIMKVIARETGAKLGGKLYSDAMGAKGSAGETYIGMMKENVKTIVKALKK